MTSPLNHYMDSISQIMKIYFVAIFYSIYTLTVAQFFLILLFHFFLMMYLMLHFSWCPLSTQIMLILCCPIMILHSSLFSGCMLLFNNDEFQPYSTFAITPWIEISETFDQWLMI